MSTGPLNLADANLEGFAAVEAGRYNCVVHEASMDATTNPNGNLPVGTPFIKLVYRATEDNIEGVENRQFWQNLYIPPADYDAKKAATMKGFVARTFIALGYPEEEVVSKKFSYDLEDLIGRECVVQVGKEQKRDRDSGEPIEGEFNNPVKGVKPAGSGVSSSSEGLL